LVGKEKLTHVKTISEVWCEKFAIFRQYVEQIPDMDVKCKAQ